MEKDIEILRKIFQELKYGNGYINIILEFIKNKFHETKLPELTPNFIYMILIPEEGREKAREIAKYFQEYKNTGNFQTDFQKILKSKGL